MNLFRYTVVVTEVLVAIGLYYDLLKVCNHLSN